MRFIHRIGLRLALGQRRQLESLGLDVGPDLALPGGSDPLVAFDVDEGHENWPVLKELFAAWRVHDLVRTQFSRDELQAARWLEVVPDWHHGYPQPREFDFGYLEATYDLSEYCSVCGIGKKQKAPFQMKAEPKWGRRGILQLNWVFDELFVTPEVWSGVFKPHGIASLPVLNTKGQELKTVVQLTTCEHVSVDVTGLAFESCSKCGRIKYLPHTRGFYPPLLVEPAGAMVKTNEYFGSGASAHNGVVVCQTIARALNAAGVRGASFKPVGEG